MDIDINIETNNQFSHDQETLDRLNTPEQSGQSMDEADKLLFEKILSLINSKTINLYSPSSLINHEVYDSIPDDVKSKADINMFNLLATIREIHKLWEADHSETFQLNNLVHKFRLTKERLENDFGDVYII